MIKLHVSVLYILATSINYLVHRTFLKKFDRFDSQFNHEPEQMYPMASFDIERWQKSYFVDTVWS